MKRLNQQGNASITAIIVIAIAAIIALILGVQLGSGDYYSAALWFGIGLSALYIVHLHRYTWQIATFMVFLGFSLYPLGFEITADHVAFLLGAMLGMLYLLSSRGLRPNRELSDCGVRGMQVGMLLWICYGAVHLTWNHFFPYLPSEYAFKNAIKSYFPAFGMTALLLWFLIKPNGIRAGRNWGTVLVGILVLSLVVNIAVAIYNISIGFGILDQAFEGSGAMAPTSLLIPVINLTPGFYILRTISSIAVAMGLLFLTSSSGPARRNVWGRVLVVAAVILGIAGAVLSSGRGVIIVTGGYAFMIALFRRRLILLVASAFAGLLLIVFVNLFSVQINQDAPYFVQRSLQMFMIEKGVSARTIENSSEWRQELAEMAFEEWRSDARITFFGRASYSYSEADRNLTEQLGGYEAGKISSLRRGATHLLVTDCLIQYGIVGLILYYLMLLSIIRFLYLLHREQRRRETEFHVLTLFLLISFVLMLPMSLVTGAWIATQHGWLLLLLIVGYAQEVRSRREQVSPSVAQDQDIGRLGERPNEA